MAGGNEQSTVAGSQNETKAAVVLEFEIGGTHEVHAQVGPSVQKHPQNRNQFSDGGGSGTCTLAGTQTKNAAAMPAGFHEADKASVQRFRRSRPGFRERCGKWSRHSIWGFVSISIFFRLSFHFFQRPFFGEASRGLLRE